MRGVETTQRFAWTHAGNDAMFQRDISRHGGENGKIPALVASDYGLLEENTFTPKRTTGAPCCGGS